MYLLPIHLLAQELNAYKLSETDLKMFGWIVLAGERNRESLFVNVDYSSMYSGR